MRLLLEQECAAVAGGDGDVEACVRTTTLASIGFGAVLGAAAGSAVGGAGAAPGAIGGAGVGALVAEVVAEPLCEWAHGEEEEEEESDESALRGNPFRPTHIPDGEGSSIDTRMPLILVADGLSDY